MTLEQIRKVKAIDFHSHFGDYHMTRGIEYAQKYIPGDIEFLRRGMELANIGLALNSHLKGLQPRGCTDAVAANEICLKDVENAADLYMWAVVNPRQKESYEQAAQLLTHPKCVGIKIHPEEHLYPIMEFGEEIFEFAAKNNALIKTHSGEANSMPEDFCVFANRYPEVKILCSHLGCGWDGSFEHQVRAIQCNAHGNLFTDTSSQNSMISNILELSVKEIGSEKILFGTDTPCYFSPSQRARVDYADISEDDKLNILYRNATREFPHIKKIYENLYPGESI